MSSGSCASASSSASLVNIGPRGIASRCQKSRAAPSFGQADLCERDEVIERDRTRELLPQEPPHLTQRGGLSEPSEQRIVLAWTVVLKVLEPPQESRGIARCAIRDGRDPHALGLDPVELDRAKCHFFFKIGAPVDFGHPWSESHPSEAR